MFNRKEIEKLKKQKNNLIRENDRLKNELTSKDDIIENLDLKKINEEIAQANERLKRINDSIHKTHEDIALQDLGFFDELENTQPSIEIQSKISENKSAQKSTIIKNGIDFSNVDYSLITNKQKAKTIISNYAKSMLSVFNRDCDRFIEKSTLGNIVSTSDQIFNAYDRVNKMGQVFGLKLTANLRDLKLERLHLEYRLLISKKQEKENERIRKEIIKDQLKAEKELSDEKTKLEAELNKLIKNQAKEIDIAEVKRKLAQNEERSKKPKSGWVYVVGNSDMARYGNKKQIKIGITRRESVDKRLSELGGASHSFGIDLYGTVFVEDCFALESTLHTYFAKKRVNQCRRQKEWFTVTLDEVKVAFKEIANIDIELTYFENEEYIISKKINKILDI